MKLQKPYQMLRKMLLYMLVLFICVSMIPAIAMAEDNTSIIPITSESDILNSLAGAHAGDNFVFELQDDLNLNSGLDGNDKIIIPTGVTVTFTNTAGKAVTVTRNWDLSGIPFSAMITVDGTLIVEENTTDGGSLTFTGARSNFADASMFLVRGNMQLHSGIIANCVAINGGAIYGEETSTIEISGGLLTANTAKKTTVDNGFGGAVFSNGNLIISGGEISINSANHGGAIYATGNLTISGGEIKENNAENSGAGITYNDLSNKKALMITGGTISDNVADGMYGGGLDFSAGRGAITGGTFSGNSSFMMGGGMFINEGAEVSMTRIVIYNNNAGAQGGGLYNCPTGGGDYRKYRGLTLYNNKAYTKNAAYEGGDDFYSAEEKASGITKDFIYLSDYTLNASKISWYKDEGGNRYVKGNAPAKQSYYQNSDEVIALKSGASQTDYEQSLAMGTVFFQGNSSMSGGGIANNGILNIGYSTALTIEKKVSGEPNGADDTFTFTVTLTNNNDAPYVGDVLYEYNNAESTVTFDKNGQASLTLHSNESVILFNIPVNTRYEVEEIPTEGFVLTDHTGASGVIDFTENTTASFTNTYQSAVAQIGCLKITKTVTGTGTPAPDTTFNFTVKNGTAAAVGNYSIDDGTAVSIPTSGEISLANGQTATLTDLAVGNYTITESLPSQANYKSTKYKVSNESDSNGLTANAIITNGNTEAVEFTNAYEQKNIKVSVKISKVWQDNNNQDGIRPNDVTVKLFANGADTGKTVVLNAGNNWAASFTDLPQKKDGADIAYTLQEVTVTDYTSVISGDAADGFTITNSHAPETVSVEGTKTWNDSNNQEGKRPASITVNVLANGTIVDTKTVTEADGWSWSFTNLPKNEAGQAINYTVTEKNVAGYTAMVSGYNITNSRMPSQWITENPKPQDPNIPQTEDNSNYLLWIVLMLVSAGLLWGSVVWEKKRRHNK